MIARNRPLRFAAVGLLNTVVGYSVILLGLGLGLDDIPANLLGYAFGLLQGFFLNRNWTFDSRAAPFSTGMSLYAFAFLLAYLCNLATVLLLIESIGLPSYIAHLAGIFVYSIVFFVLCSWLVFSEGRVTGAGLRRAQEIAHRILAISRGQWPEIAAFGCLSVFFLFLFDMPVTHDLLWRLWIGEQLLGGAVLYRDILELNPPLWFWSAKLIEQLVALLGISGKVIAISEIFAYLAISLWFLSRLWQHEIRTRRAILLLAVLTASIIIPLGDFGQREHIAAIAAFPYLALIANRLDGREHSWLLATAIGLFAAYGFAHKHYFALVPLLLEGLYFFRARNSWSLLRPETLVMGIGASFYALAILLVTPEFLFEIVPTISAAYYGYEISLLKQLRSLWLLPWVLGALAFLLSGSNRPALLSASAAAFFAFALSYFLQEKGWRYHALPASVLVGFMSIVAILYLPRRKLIALWYASAILPFLWGMIVGPYKNPYEGDATAILSEAQRGDTVAVFSVNASLLWPTVDNLGFIWPHRYFTFWMLPAIARVEAKRYEDLPPDLARLAERVVENTSHDLRCNPPDLIVVDDIGRSGSIRGSSFDIWGFFGRDPQLYRLLSHYEKVTTAGRFTGFAPRDTLPKFDVSECRPIASAPRP